MSEVRLKGIYPIGDSDPAAMPAPDAEAASDWYVQNLGFQVTSRAEAPHRSVTLARDDVRLTLAENGGDPHNASCYIEVSDVDAAYGEAEALGIVPSPMRIDTHGGARYRVFFIKDPVGLCYCVGQKLAA
jgi:hypothetical protein